MLHSTPFLFSVKCGNKISLTSGEKKKEREREREREKMSKTLLAVDKERKETPINRFYGLSI